MSEIQEAARQLTAILLTYAVYSTVTSLVLLLIVRPRWIGAPEVRLRCWRAGLVAPILLAVVAPWTAWSPVVTLPIAAPPSGGLARDVAASWRGDGDGDGEARAAERADRPAAAWSSGTDAPRSDRGPDAAGPFVPSRGWPFQIAVVAAGGWFAIAALGWLRTLSSLRGLRKLVATGTPVRDARLVQEFQFLKQRAGCSRAVASTSSC